MEFGKSQSSFELVRNKESAPITLIEPGQAPPLARPYYADGDPGPIVAALAQVPELLVVTMPFLGAAGPPALPARTKELVILRTSARAACRYCVESHTVVARDIGLSATEVALSVARRMWTQPFRRRRRGVLDWCDAIVGTGPVRTRPPGGGSWASLPNHAVVELTLLVAATLLLNRFCTALELPTSDSVLARLGSEGWR